MDEIKNKVKGSGLIQLDLADYKPRVPMVGIDLAAQLWQGLVLKEKDFRAWIKENDWDGYENKAVFIFCSADAIVPTWAYMLVASALQSISKKVLVGTQLDLEKALITEAITAIDLTEFQDGKVIVKGCSDIAAPEFAMVTLLAHLQGVVQSIMYGEPCSTVPIYKRKNV
ncbi:MAG: hypothetical protein RL293_220 [Bacteroidota bacterium]